MLITEVIEVPTKHLKAWDDVSYYINEKNDDDDDKDDDDEGAGHGKQEVEKSTAAHRAREPTASARPTRTTPSARRSARSRPT